MNYTMPDSNKQFKTNDLVPELPTLTKLPRMLSQYTNWVCWVYEPLPEGILTRRTVSEPSTLAEAYKQCMDKDLGLGFQLTALDPFTVITIAPCRDDDGNLSPDAVDIARITQTYNVEDKKMGELYIIAYTDDLAWDVCKNGVRMASDQFVFPLTPHDIGAYPDIQERTKQFETIARRYCPMSWMEKLEILSESTNEATAISRVLAECLDTPNWLDDAESTDLYEFLYLIWWDHPRLQLKVYKQIEKDIRHYETRVRAFKSIEAIMEKMRAERKPDKSKSSGKVESVPEFDDDDWMNALHYDKRSKKVIEDFYNITLTLENHNEWEGRFSFDSFQHKALLDGEQPLSDPEEAKIIRWFGATDPFEFSGNREKLYQRAIYATAFQKTFDSLYDFITSLEWDGISRLLTWMTDMCGAPATPHSAWIGKMTIMQMTARALKPGIMARQVPIWEGPENKGKTRMISILGKPWAITFDMSMDNKESHMAIQGVWVAEIAELNALKATRTETRIKSFISQTEDSFIPKYSNNRVSLPRRCCFIGTTNDDDYLPSLTGNTRWYPIRTEWFDHQRIEQERNQLFAEAVSILKNNPNTAWWEEPQGLQEKIRATRDERRPFNAYEGDLKGWLDDRTPDIGLDRNTTSWNEIAGHFLQIDKEKWKDKSLQAQITSALKALGWTRKKLGESGKGLTVWVRPENDDS